MYKPQDEATICGVTREGFIAEGASEHAMNEQLKVQLHSTKREDLGHRRAQLILENMAI